jgi:TonB-linked SusC/RagA family outer membrane protein
MLQIYGTTNFYLQVNKSSEVDSIFSYLAFSKTYADMRNPIMRFIVALLFLPQLLLAQSRTVSGTVTDERGAPLASVSVVQRGTNTGTVTTETGTFTITVTGASPVLQFSYAGFQPQELPVGNSDTYNVTLSAAGTLSEVVVTALGITRERRSLGYSAQGVSAEDLTRNRQPNIVNALQGKVAGVQINATGGAPGQGARIIIRGITSLDPNRSFQPLFVVDGIPIDNGTDVGGAGELRGLSNRAADINPDDIESINILKGGAATALYGLRASTGVVVITTKSGRAGKVRASVTSTFGTEEVNKYPDVQTRFTQGFVGAQSRVPEYDPASFWPSWGPAIAEARQADPTHPAAIFNNYKQGYQRGHFFRNTVNLSGGTETAVLAGSFSQLSHEGVLPFSDYKNYSARVNGDLKFSSKLRVGASLNYINSGGDRVNADRYNEQLTYWSPRWDVMDYIKEDGTMKTYGPDNDNPVYIASTNRYRDNVNRVIGNTHLTFTPLKWLSISYRAGADVFNDARIHTAPGPKGLVGERHPFGDNEFGFVEEYRINKRILNSTAIVSFNNQITKQLSSSFKVGHDLYDEKLRSHYTYGDTLVVPDFFNVRNAKRVTGRDSVMNYRIIGLFGDWTLSWSDYLYLTLTGRNDWTSTLPKENRSFFYPSASLSYVFSQNFALPDWMTFGKVRASVAKIGKDALPYATSTGYTIETGIGGVLPFTLSDVTGDIGLRPEFTTSREFGAEIRFLKNRIGLDVTYYNNTSKDLITPVAIPVSSGFDKITLNAGSIRNRGVEISVDGSPVRTSDFNWNVRVNYSRNKSTVLEIYPGLTEIVMGTQFGYLSSGVTQKLIPGQPVGSLFGRSYARYYGTDKEDEMFIDQGRPVVIGANGFPTINTKQMYLGNSQPKWIGSIFNEVEYKNFSFSLLFDAQQGLQKYNQMANFLAAFGIAKYTEDRTETRVFEGVLADGTPNTKVVYLGQGKGPDGADYGNGFYRNVFRGVSENFVEDASWIRLRSASVAYSVPRTILSKTKIITGASLSLTGNNLWLHTDYTGFDPESSSNSSGSVVDAFAGFTYPATRSYIVTLNLTF